MNWTLLVVIVVLAFVFLLSRGGGGSLVSAEELSGVLQQNPKIIDVRTVGEYQDGHLPRSINVPLADLGRQIGRHAPDKDGPILLYCASGSRSSSGKKALERLGYVQIHNLGSFRRAQALLK